jgi:hypothetical protein
MSPARPDAAPAVKPIEVSGELKALMRRLKLGQLLDTLPERLALARSNRLPHHDFLEMLLADEVTRRDRESAARRAKAAHLDPRCSCRPGTTPPRSTSTSSCGPS